MVGDPADADAVGVSWTLVVVDAQRLGRGGDDRPEDVDLEVRRHPLEAAAAALQAHAGVDVLLGQRLELARAESG